MFLFRILLEYYQNISFKINFDQNTISILIQYIKNIFGWLKIHPYLYVGAMPYRMFSTLPSSASVSPQVTGGLQAIDCTSNLSSTGIFYQTPVDFYARRCQISHTALLIYQPPSFIERLACFIEMRTLSANCAGKLHLYQTARSRGSTHSQSQRGSRSSSHFTGSPFRSSQFADYPPPNDYKITFSFTRRRKCYHFFIFVLNRWRLVLRDNRKKFPISRYFWKPKPILMSVFPKPKNTENTKNRP